MKLNKRVLTLLMVLMMVLGLAACGGGKSPAGIYKLTKMSSDNIEMTTEEMTELFGMEVEMSLELKDDNSFVLDLGFMGDGERNSGTWKLDGDSLTLSADGQDIKTTFDGKTIVLEEGTEVLTFEKQ